MMEVHQTLPTMDVADAISNDAFRIREILKVEGFESQIYAEHIHPNFKWVRNYKQLRKVTAPLLHHFSIGSDVNDFVSRLPNKKILIYHNITPPQFIMEYNATLADLCRLGREQIKGFRNNTVLALGDSEYDRRELESMGFDNTDVLPILMDFDQFKKFNKNIYEKFSDGFTNILFVGRLIPNKRIEHLVKIFYYYNNYINPNSRLILAGSYSGMESYHNQLIKMTKKLGVYENTVFTGKISREDLSAYYRVATNFVCMSEHEGFCVPLLEAMFFKIPIVAYNSTAVPFTLGNSGILVNEKDFEGIAELLDILNSDTPLRKRIIKNQNERLKDFGPRKVKSKLLEIVYTLVESC
ncbi:MAG: glycosyltransferase [Candidatus Micrarchaeota archaeon]|nr:glycosyltransferase [Candidatus Micrarchaeota archaeon]